MKLLIQERVACTFQQEELFVMNENQAQEEYSTLCGTQRCGLLPEQTSSISAIQITEKWEDKCSNKRLIYSLISIK